MRTCVRMTHPPGIVSVAQDLGSAGLTAGEISVHTGVPRRTIVDWLAGRVPGAASNRSEVRCPRCLGRHVSLDALPDDYVYLLGLYLGDGCISTHPRGVYRLRIKLDAKYPMLIEEAATAIHAIVPNNAVGRVLHLQSWVELGAYSKGWPCLFPQHGVGKKHTRRIALEPWQLDTVGRTPDLLLRGLIHSDGCRFSTPAEADGGVRATPSATYPTTSAASSATRATSWSCIGPPPTHRLRLSQSRRRAHG